MALLPFGRCFPEPHRSGLRLALALSRQALVVERARIFASRKKRPLQARHSDGRCCHGQGAPHGKKPGRRIGRTGQTGPDRATRNVLAAARGTRNVLAVAKGTRGGATTGPGADINATAALWPRARLSRANSADRCSAHARSAGKPQISEAAMQRFSCPYRDGFAAIGPISMKSPPPLAVSICRYAGVSTLREREIYNGEKRKGLTLFAPAYRQMLTQYACNQAHGSLRRKGYNSA